MCYMGITKLINKLGCELCNIIIKLKINWVNCKLHL